MKRPRLALLSLTCASLWMLSSAAFADEPIYRGIDDKGHPVYSNSPKGLRNAKKISLPEPAISGTTPFSSPSTPAPFAAADPAGPAPTATKPALPRLDVSTIESELNQALAAQESGKEPLPGERLGTATGGSRLSPAYFSRQAELAQAVEKAKARMAQATASH